MVRILQVETRFQESRMNHILRTLKVCRKIYFNSTLFFRRMQTLGFFSRLLGLTSDNILITGFSSAIPLNSLIRQEIQRSLPFLRGQPLAKKKPTNMAAISRSCAVGRFAVWQCCLLIMFHIQINNYFTYESYLDLQD